MQQEFYRELLDSLADGVYFVDMDHRITYWNKSAERISGYTAEEVQGKKCSSNILQHVDYLGNPLCAQGCPLAATLEDGEMREMEVFLHNKFGHRVPVAVRATPMRDESGKIIGAVEVFSNNSKNICIINEVEELRNEVLKDPLTGIGNRRYADITMKQLEQNMLEYRVPFGVLFVDIDHFKRVNDTWGHDVGDQVLRMVAQTLSGSLRSLDVVCRWGGEEFIILAPNVTLEALEAMAQRLCMLIENCWFDHFDQQIKVTVSIGGAVSQPGESPASVIARADKQVYKGKESGRNCARMDKP
jgi:diguanylate cyclase (GGDEF)-like protein/PAS domain S-box-containing protein